MMMTAAAVGSIDALREDGFEGFRRVGQLDEGGCEEVPVARGVYALVRDTLEAPEFLARSTAGWWRGQDPAIPIAELEAHWVDGSQLLYVGRAGGPGVRSLLQQRVKRYLRFGRGKRVAHWGGRLVWQLRDHAALRVAWRATAEEDPAAVEARLLAAFVETFGRLPFANLRGESEA